MCQLILTKSKDTSQKKCGPSKKNAPKKNTTVKDIKGCHFTPRMASEHLTKQQKTQLDYRQSG